MTRPASDRVERVSPAEPALSSARLPGCPQPPAAVYDVALLDLDGVLYVGADPIPGAAPALAAARELGMRLAFVTNNASRAPGQVARRLREQSVPAETADVVTSAQAAARMLSDRLAAGDAVLVVGGDSLRDEVTAAGFRAVDTADPQPAAVVQGYSPETTYPMLAEAALAVGRGAWWVGTNADATIPSPRGLLPGNGALLAVVATATGRQPVIAGKPEIALHVELIERTQARRPLVVGDRLDTDIRGARRGHSASLHVLTGVDGPEQLLAAAPQDRPTLLSLDLSGLLEPHPEVTARLSDKAWAAECGGWLATVGNGALGMTRTEPGSGLALDALRAACVAAWAAADAGMPVRRREPAAAEALDRLGDPPLAPPRC